MHHAKSSYMVHIHWASHARDHWSHAGLHSRMMWYTYVYSIFSPYWVKNEISELSDLHEITNFVQEMLSVCAPLIDGSCTIEHASSHPAGVNNRKLRSIGEHINTRSLVIGHSRRVRCCAFYRATSLLRKRFLEMLSDIFPYPT